MTGHELLVQKLNEQFLHFQAKNPSFSLRSFARKLNLSISAVSEIRNGKRRVSAKMAAKLADKLLLSPDEKEILLEGFTRKPNRENDGPSSKKYLQLSADQFHAIGEWQHFAILALMKVKGFRHSAAWIARRLGIPVTVAEQALTRLKRLGLVEETPAKTLKRTPHSLSSSDEIANLAVRKAHLQDLELIKEKLSAVELTKRDSTSVTMAIDPRKLPEAKRMIREFRDRLSDCLESGARSEVYKLSMHLFPLTESENEI